MRIGVNKMFDATKAVINNINQFKYIKNRDRVHVKKIPIEGSKTMVQQTRDGSFDTIDKLQNEYRINNLNVFFRNYGKLRWRRFWIVSLPAILASACVVSFFPPKRISSQDSLPTYEKTTKIYNSNFGEAVDTTIGYVYDGGTSTYDLADGLVGFKSSDIQDKVELKIYNQEDYLAATTNISSSDMLNVQNVHSGLYYDFTDYDNMDFKDVGRDYDKLYDKLIQTIKSNPSLNADTLELLESLDSDEKKEVIIEVQKYIYLGETDVIVTKSKVTLRIALFGALIASLLISGCWYFDSRVAVKDSENDDDKNNEIIYKAVLFPELNHKNGLLKEEDEKCVNLLFQSLKYKEAFLAAERERLCKLDDEIADNIVSSDQDALLTKYEKKLIQKIRAEESRSKGSSSNREL